MAECSRIFVERRDTDGGGVGDGADRFSTGLLSMHRRTLPYGWAWTLSQVILMADLRRQSLLMHASRSSCWPTARSGRRCRCAAGPTWWARSACCKASPTCSSSCSRKSIIPAGANKVLFLLAPLVTSTLAFARWAVVPLERRAGSFANINVGILYLFAISSLGVYGIIMARLGVEFEISVPRRRCAAAAQMVSYEVSIGFVMITVLLFAGSLNLSAIVRAQAGMAGSRSPCCSRCS